jgi:hypothetical protein
MRTSEQVGHVVSWVLTLRGVASVTLNSVVV